MHQATHRVQVVCGQPPERQLWQAMYDFCVLRSVPQAVAVPSTTGGVFCVCETQL